MGEGLGGGGLRLFVVVLAVDDGREAVPGILVDVLPDVEHAAAGGVHQHAAPGPQELHLRHRDPEGGKQHDILRPDLRVAGGGVHLLGEDTDAQPLDAEVHIRVVDDLSGEKDPPLRELLLRLIGVFHRAVHAVAEPELPGQPEHEVAGPGRVVELLQPLHHPAVVVLGQDRPHHRLQVEALLEVGLAHQAPA
jgi:hypothetical protein